MKIIQLTQEFCKERNCVALGFFDGVHVGHLALLNKVLEVSKERNCKSAVLTFDHQPSSQLLHTKEMLITSLSDKVDLFQKLGFDYVFVLPFNETIKNLSPFEFIENILIKNKVCHTVCGYDFRFGHFGKGSASLLQQQTAFSSTVVDKQSINGIRISSTLIKQIIQEGNVALARAYLGRSYQITGTVVHGKKRGRLLGFATANINYKNYVLPRVGVYATKVKVQGLWYFAMANIGMNPTFGDLEKKSLEVHIFDFDYDIYDQTMEVYFEERCRDEVKFNDFASLIEQLTNDKNQIINYFKKMA